jgi:hypothetical protein
MAYLSLYLKLQLENYLDYQQSAVFLPLHPYLDFITFLIMQSFSVCSVWIQFILLNVTILRISLKQILQL